MERAQAATEFDYYDALAELVERVKLFFPSYRVSLQPTPDNKKYIFNVDHLDGYVNSIQIWKDRRSNEDQSDYVDRLFAIIKKDEKKFLQKKYHLQTGVHATEFTVNAVKRIERLARVVLAGEYDGIEILDSTYSTSQFKFWIAALTKNKGGLRSKAEPVVYISIAEFFNQILFDRIYGFADERQMNPEWANEWTEINMSLPNTFEIPL